MIKDKECPNTTISQYAFHIQHGYIGELIICKEILSSATILPVEENWRKVLCSTRKHKELDYSESLEIHYKQGVIVQSKQ